MLTMKGDNNCGEGATAHRIRAARRPAHVRFGSKADMGLPLIHVRFAPNSGHRNCARAVRLASASGSLAMFAAIRRASSLRRLPTSNLAQPRYWLGAGYGDNTCASGACGSHIAHRASVAHPMFVLRSAAWRALPDQSWPGNSINQFDARRPHSTDTSTQTIPPL